ncbi:MAG: protein kinase, partial [Gemmatimonadaceae bacterium]
MIERELGQGGMATVYLAEDVKHHRKVAIKVLHPELSALLGPERFLKEIELTANLQHPHILPLFDSGSADGHLYYVMPYVEGETLRRKLDREQQLPIGEAVRIAADVASALEYAHKRGVIHRDVKPENILLHDGRPLVADFGIALAVQQAGGTRMTQTGMSLGTPQYMAPEQAMGDKSVDHRADIYALGAVTYEMLTGEPPFVGPNSQAVVAKVLTTDPVSLAVKRRSVPPHVEDAVLTALEKMPADRFASAGEFASAIAGGAAVPAAQATTTRRTRATQSPEIRGRRLTPVMLAVAGALLLAAAGAGWALRSLSDDRVSAGPVRFTFAIGAPGQDGINIAISPDGRRIVQSITDSSGTPRLVMRDIGSTEIGAIAGTDGARTFDFSPDGEWIVFTAGAESKLRKVPSRGGPPADIVDSAGSPSWGDDGNIVYTKGSEGVWRVSSSGGAATQLTALDTARREFGHFNPQTLPGNRGIIYTSYATPMSRARIEAYDFAKKRRKVLVEGAVFGRYSSSGHLLYMRDGAIFAVKFDPKRLEIRGDAVPVQDDVAWEPTGGLGAFAVSSTGTLAYIRASDWNVDRRLVWLDRAGVETPVLPRPGAYAEPRLSPDGRWIALTMSSPKRDIWLYERARGILTRLTRANAAAFSPVWTPDSRAIVYTHEDPVYDLNRIPIDGSAPTQRVVRTPWDKMASSVSPDGRTIAYTENRAGLAIHAAPLNGSGRPGPLMASDVNQQRAVFSPTGRWVAYEEAAGDRGNVFIASADGSGGRRQVSVDGGSQPRWTRDGREIVYRRGEAMFAVAVDPATGDVGRPVELFSRRQFNLDVATFGYDVSSDGNRFVMAVPVTRPEA